MTWLIEQCIKNDSHWLIASLLTGFLYFYDERSWRGFAIHGFQYEMQRFRTHVAPLVILSVSLPLIATMYHGFLWQFLIAIGSASTFYIYQQAVHDFSGRTLSGAAKRIFLFSVAILLLVAFVPGVPVAWIPVMFATAGIATSLSSRNHLIFKLSEDTLAIRHQLASSHADRHNAALFSVNSGYHQSSSDNTLKAG